MQKVNETLLGKYCKLIIDSAKPMVKLQLTDELKNSDIKVRSQFAGAPYWPTKRLDFWNSLVKEYGDLSLLVQLNLSEIKDSRLPQSGLMQVFMVGESYCIFEDDPSESENNKDVKGSNRYHLVVYHNKDSLADMNFTNVKTLFLEDCEARVLKAIPGTSVINMSNTNDINKLIRTYGISEDDIDELYRMSGYNEMKKIYDAGLKNKDVAILVEKALKLMEDDEVSSRVGGYPNFTQDDERLENSSMTELLVQLSSDEEIMFGDFGDIQVFTSVEALKNLNEDEVISSYYIFQCH